MLLYTYYKQLFNFSNMHKLIYKYTCRFRLSLCILLSEKDILWKSKPFILNMVINGSLFYNYKQSLCTTNLTAIPKEYRLGMFQPQPEFKENRESPRASVRESEPQEHVPSSAPVARIAVESNTETPSGWSSRTSSLNKPENPITPAHDTNSVLDKVALFHKVRRISDL